MLLFFILLIAGCKTQPVRMDNVGQANWRARALITDKEHAKKYILVLEMNAIRNERMRVDATSTLGQPIASLVATDSEVRYFTTESKKFYFGPPRPDSLKSILAIPFDPRWLQNILFDEPIAAKNWTCKTDEKGLLTECLDKNTDMKIVWRNRQGEGRNIDIIHAKGEIQMSFRSFNRKIDGPADKLFALQPPPGFQEVKIK